jgi:hypothetical protein
MAFMIDSLSVSLRDLLAPKWERSNEGNLPFTVNEAKTIALSVATGDEQTISKPIS